MTNWNSLACMLLTCLILCACQHNRATIGAPSGYWNTYGQQPLGEGDAIAIGAISGDERDVVIHGTIVEVCSVKGCWMTIRDEHGHELFVKFKDYGFFVPRNAAGRNVVVHGWVEKKVMSVEELRHYATDAGRTPQQIAAITQPETRFTFYADSVMIAGGGLQQPYVKQPGDECY